MSLYSGEHRTTRVGRPSNDLCLCGLVAVGALLAQACATGDDGGAGVAVTTTDSAGVRIVDHAHTRDDLQSLPRWRIGDDPSFVVDTVEESGERRALYAPGLVVPLADGQVLVAEDRTLLVFDRAGALVRSLGGEGEGPGEYQRVMGAGALPD